MKNIAVFFGGNSVERDVSIITGVLASNSVDKEKYNPIPVYVSEDGTWYTGQTLFDLDEYKNWISSQRAKEIQEQIEEINTKYDNELDMLP